MIKFLYISNTKSYIGCYYNNSVHISLGWHKTAYIWVETFPWIYLFPTVHKKKQPLFSLTTFHTWVRISTPSIIKTALYINLSLINDTSQFCSINIKLQYVLNPQSYIGCYSNNIIHIFLIWSPVSYISWTISSDIPWFLISNNQETTIICINQVSGFSAYLNIQC